MTQSIDGKVTGDFLSSPECADAIETYYEINRAYQADAFACGRVTMEGSFTFGYFPDLSKFKNVYVPSGDFIADYKKKFFAVSFDRHGKLGWKNSVITDEDPGYGEAHIIEVLCKDTKPEYIAYLRKTGVSYIFAGENDIDLSLATEKLHSLFGIETLLLEGGSIINGAFIRAGLVDELSLVVAPLIAQADDKPLFYNSTMSEFKLIETKTHENGTIWINYKRK